jgi:DNA-binding GntR family transcriptional regulator
MSVSEPPRPDLTPAAPQSAAAAATEVLRNAIIDGTLEPGHELGEQDLARQLGVSRTPVREALVVLEADGLVEMTRSRAARVKILDRAERVEMYELRARIEGYMARRAAEEATAAQLHDLFESCDRYAAALAEDVLVLRRENLYFHRKVFEASRAKRAPLLVRGLVELPLLYSSYSAYSTSAYSPDRRPVISQQHRAIAEALERRDPVDAERLMMGHVLEASAVAMSDSRS